MDSIQIRRIFQVRTLSASGFTLFIDNIIISPSKNTGCIDTQITSSPVTILPDDPEDYTILDLQQAVKQGVAKPDNFLPFSITPFHLASFLRNYQTVQIYDVRSTWVRTEVGSKPI